MDKLQADVCVIGAGYAGLMAARRLTQAGKTVVVLEARNRVGGRVWTLRGPEDTPIDLGGAWIGPGQESVRSLVDDLGFTTYPTYDEGDNLFVANGVPLRYRRSIAEAVPAAAEFSPYLRRLDAMAATLPVEAPWDGENSEHWDAESMAAWIEREVKESFAAVLLEKWLRMLFCVNLAEVSLLNVLFVIRSAGSLRILLGKKGGYNQDHIHGGAQGMALRIADDLDGRLRLESPARSVVQGADGVRVRADAVEVEASRVIMALLPVHAAQLAYEPQLPTDRAMLYAHSPNGMVLKTAAVYAQPFWRAEGLTGESVDTSSLLGVTMDTSPEDARTGVLTGYAYGPPARELGRLEPGQRRKFVLETLVDRFGPKAATPLHYVDQDWSADAWSRGCHLVHYAGGVLTQYGPVIREPFGRIHFAGTETATVSHGAIDGACRSGERAVAEVLSDQ